MAYKPASTGGSSAVSATATASSTSDPFNGASIATGYMPANPLTETQSGDVNRAPFINNAKGTVPSNSLTDPELQKQIANSGKSSIEAIQTKLKDAGYSVDITGIWDNNSAKAYQDVELSAAYNQQQGVKITPDALLDSLVAARTKAADQSKDTSSTDTTVNVTNPTAARQAITTAMDAKLGRKPNAQELAAFTTALNNYETDPNNSATETTNTSVDGDGNVKSQNTTTTDKGTGNLSFTNDFANQYIQDNNSQELGDMNKLSWYNVAMNALGSSGINTGNPT